MCKDILVFELRGKEAHFRDRATNSVALTYPFPPRTTIIGILGAMMGRADYYDIFSPSECNISIELMTENFTHIDTFNYMSTKKGRMTNIPVEFLYEKNMEQIRYWIYIQHNKKEVLDEIEDRLKKSNFKYGCPKLGKIYCLGYAEFIDKVSDFSYEDKDEVLIDSVTPVNAVKRLDFYQDYEDDRKTVKVDVQRVMGGNRELIETCNYFVPLNLKGVYIKKLQKPYVKLNVQDKTKKIFWL